MFNGIMGVKLHHESACAIAYNYQDIGCSIIISMMINPGLITPDNLRSKVNVVYHVPIQQSQMKWECNQLLLYEPTTNLTKPGKLTVVPIGFSRHILFAAFHANLLGGYLSLYYTLHQIRLRYDWPHLHLYVKQNINDYVACVLRKNGGTRASSKLLYQSSPSLISKNNAY
jgi:hypothetical protein